MPLIVHTWWGTLFCLPFGFSLSAGRISALSAALLLLFAVYIGLRSIGAQRFTSLVAISAIAVTPAFFVHSYSYQTDLTFSLLFSIAFLLYSAAAYHISVKLMWSAFIFALGSAFVRDVGLAAPIAAFAPLLVIHRRFSRFATLPIVHVAIIGAALFAFREWMLAKGILPILYDDGRTRLLHTFNGGIGQLITTSGKNILQNISYLGFFLLPTTLLFSGNFRFSSSEKKTLLTVFSFIIACILASWAVDGSLLQRIWIFLFDHLLRNDWIPDIHNSFYPRLPAPKFLQNSLAILALTTGSTFSAVAVIAIQRIYHSKQQSYGYYVAIAAVGVSVIYLTPLVIANTFSRYLIVIFPLFAYIISYAFGVVGKISRLAMLLSIALLAVFGAVSITTTRDNFSRYRSLEKAQTYLLDSLHINPESIDGGFCFNGWQMYDSKYQSSKNKNWWWVKDDLYLLRGSRVAGYHAAAFFPFQRLFAGGRTDTTFVLKRFSIQ